MTRFRNRVLISLEVWGAGIDEMPKSQIEKRKRNMESTSQEEKREMSRSVFWFEKRTRIFAKKMEKC